MKLIRFSLDNESPQFGVVVNECAMAFNQLQTLTGASHTFLSDSHAYLAALPQSEQVARELSEWAALHFDEITDMHRLPLTSVHLHAPIVPTALFDLGLTPKHLANSAETMLKYERDDPQTGPLVEAFRRMVLSPRPASTSNLPERLSYYKSNLNSISGDGVTVPWPIYTSRFDIEPELAVIYGNAAQPIAGYCIFNDLSARDVQAPEIIGGFCLSKDMAMGNQLGPYWVTSDEVGNPYDQEVTVTVDGNLRFKGSTSEISHTAEQVFSWLGLICPLLSGSVMGMGTIPACTGMDHDEFLDPGAHIAIRFSKLGTLRCTLGEPTGKLLPSRWPLREALKKYHA